jgi:hypothetical protein
MLMSMLQTNLNNRELQLNGWTVMTVMTMQNAVTALTLNPR